LKNFFWKYLHLSSSRLLPVIDDHNEYASIRAKIVEQPTSAEQQALSRIATITKQDQDGMKRESKWDRCLIVHYKHEQRLAAFKKDLHRLWNEAFAETPIKNTRLIVGNRISLNTKRQLIHNRPAKHSDST
jgi:hypothetical protein